MRQPDDAEARRAKPPVVCYPVEGLPQPDMAMLGKAREKLTKIDEVIVPPRGARTGSKTAYNKKGGHEGRLS